jgi:mRNA interferase RelE/StbE
LTWQVKISDQARKDLRSLDHQIQRLILKYLDEKIATKENPRRFGKILTGDKAGLWRYRVMDYCIICAIQDAKLIVLVLKMDHRTKVYDD